jgi:hypothetical protein
MGETKEQRSAGQKAGERVKAAAEEFNEAVKAGNARPFVVQNFILHKGLLAVQKMGQGKYFQKPAQSLADRYKLVRTVADAINDAPIPDPYSEDELRLAQARAAIEAYEEAKRHGG